MLHPRALFPIEISRNWGGVEKNGEGKISPLVTVSICTFVQKQPGSVETVPWLYQTKGSLVVSSLSWRLNLYTSGNNGTSSTWVLGFPHPFRPNPGPAPFVTETDPGFPTKTGTPGVMLCCWLRYQILLARSTLMNPGVMCGIHSHWTAYHVWIDNQVTVSLLKPITETEGSRWGVIFKLFSSFALWCK